jgi:hypothetical protein
MIEIYVCKYKHGQIYRHGVSPWPLQS